MSESRRHHFISRFLLRGFATPESDSGRIFVLDRTRKKVFESSPLNSGFRTNYNRVNPSTHSDPLVVEDFYATIESRAAPIIERIKSARSIPTVEDAAKIIDLIAIHFSRTPRFRRRIDGALFQQLEDHILESNRSEEGLRNFAERQRNLGLPEDCHTPEGFLSTLKSKDFQVHTDDNWKIAGTMQYLPLLVRVLQSRPWSVIRFNDSFDPLIISDAATGLLSIGCSDGGPVGLALTNTIIFLPISTRLALVSVNDQHKQLFTNRITPSLLNTASFAMSTDQCFSSTSDFFISEPDKDSQLWSSYLATGEFPKLYEDVGDIATSYESR